MEITDKSIFFKDIDKCLKPHPKFTHMRWAVFEGENMSVVIMEIEHGKTKERENQPPHPFTGGGPHFHADFEQIAFHLGYTWDCIEEQKTMTWYGLANHANEQGITGDGTIIWLPRYTVHDIDVPVSDEEAFMKEYYPNGVPDGTKYYIMDLHCPKRMEYVEYFKNQPVDF